jgi:hypothetical protein
MMKDYIRHLNQRLQRWRKQLRQLETGKMYFGTRESGASNWKDATKKRIEELKADIAAAESAVKELVSGPSGAKD